MIFNGCLRGKRQPGFSTIIYTNRIGKIANGAVRLYGLSNIQRNRRFNRRRLDDRRYKTYIPTINKRILKTKPQLKKCVRVFNSQ